MIPSRVKPKEEPELVDESKTDPYKPEKNNVQSPKRIDPSPKRRDPSPPRRDPSPPRRDPSPPRRDPSPPKRVHDPYESFKTDPYEAIKKEKESKPKEEYVSPGRDEFNSRDRSPSPERSPRVDTYRSRERSPERSPRVDTYRSRERSPERSPKVDNYSPKKNSPVRARDEKFDSYKENSFEYKEEPKRAPMPIKKVEDKGYDSYDENNSPPRVSARIDRPSEKRKAYDSIRDTQNERPTEVKQTFKKKANVSMDRDESYVEVAKAYQAPHNKVESQTVIKKEDPTKMLEQNLLVIALKRMVKNQQLAIENLKDDKAELIEETNELALEVKELKQKVETLEVMGKLKDFDEDNQNKVDVAHMDEKLNNINQYLDTIKYDPKQNKLMEDIIQKNKNYSDLSEQNANAMGKLKNNISALKKTLQKLNIGD